VPSRGRNLAQKGFLGLGIEGEASDLRIHESNGGFRLVEPGGVQVKEIPKVVERRKMKNKNVPKATKRETIQK